MFKLACLRCLTGMSSSDANSPDFCPTFKLGYWTTQAPPKARDGLHQWFNKLPVRELSNQHEDSPEQSPVDVDEDERIIVMGTEIVKLKEIIRRQERDIESLQF